MVSAAAAFSVASLAAAQPNQRGPEFQVNVYTTEMQSDPAVAFAGSGFVVVWSSYEQDGSGLGVFARRYDAAGNPLGGDLQVNLRTVQGQQRPAVAGAANGFVAVWQSYQQDGSDAGIFGRRFDASGNAIGVEFQANTYTTGAQESPAVAMDSTGFVVVWQSGGTSYTIFGRRWDASGNPIGMPFVISTYPTSNQLQADVALDGAGGFTVVWQGGQDNSANGIFGRRFNAGGNPLAAEFQVNLYTPGSQSNAAVARSSAGFVVVWDSDGQDGSLQAIRGRRFDSNGNAVSTEFAVNTFNSSSQEQPAVDMHPGGAFVVAWQSNQQDGEALGIAARHFDSNGTATSADFVVNTFAYYAQAGPDVALGGSRFVTVWASNLQDGSFEGVFAQRFRTHEFNLDVDGNGSVTPLTDTLLLLRYAFGFRGATLVTGAVGAGCTRCTAPAIEDYLAGEL
jgi:hypothetical protein